MRKWNGKDSQYEVGPGPYDTHTELKCPKCDNANFESARYCRECEKITEYITCPLCHEPTASVEICNDCQEIIND